MRRAFFLFLMFQCYVLLAFDGDRVLKLYKEGKLLLRAIDDRNYRLVLGDEYTKAEHGMMVKELKQMLSTEEMVASTTLIMKGIPIRMYADFGVGWLFDRDQVRPIHISPVDAFTGTKRDEPEYGFGSSYRYNEKLGKYNLDCFEPINFPLYPNSEAKFSWGQLISHLKKDYESIKRTLEINEAFVRVGYQAVVGLVIRYDGLLVEDDATLNKKISFLSIIYTLHIQRKLHELNRTSLPIYVYYINLGVLKKFNYESLTIQSRYESEVAPKKDIPNGDKIKIKSIMKFLPPPFPFPTKPSVRRNTL